MDTEVQENNKLIAEFMKYDLPNHYSLSWNKARVKDSNWIVDLNYHLSWDWLMPVYSKNM